MATPTKSPAKSKQRVPLTREGALSAAMALADVEGIDALTMRRLAMGLHVEAMSLYHHVKNKTDILDGMIDLIFSEIDMPTYDLDWKNAMVRRAVSVRSVLTRHPWAITIMESRTAPGPASLRHHDAMIGCCRNAGFSIELAARAFSLINSYTYGFVMQEVNLPFKDGDDLHAKVNDILRDMPTAEFPHLFELTTEYVLQPGYSYCNEFTFGLNLILDGLVAENQATSQGNRQENGQGKDKARNGRSLATPKNRVL
jgi:AcrR family transcriptional regulator